MVITHKKWLYAGRGGGGAWVGASGLVLMFCHPEVVKLQQQCYMQNTIFDLPQVPAGDIHFFYLGESGQYPGDSNRELVGKMKMAIQ